MSSNITRTDSYKVSHWKQYPPRTTEIYSYFESRGYDAPFEGLNPSITFFGLQYLLKEYLTKPVTQFDVDTARQSLLDHMGSFNIDGWNHIVNDHGGYLPVEIKALPEGMSVPAHNVMMTVRNTCDQCYWVTNYIETLLVQVWYPTTVATLSREAKKIIKQYLDETGGIEGLDFKLHDFGFRGVSSVESAGIGGAAHLVNFKGTDTIAALEFARKYYGEYVAGYSVPAAEHSTIMAWGRDNEVEAYRNMLKQWPTGLVAVVSDTYDFYNACENIWGGELKEEVLARDGTLVIRPDSGDPSTVVVNGLKILGDKFGFTKNDQGFKVLNPHVRMIQGDGVDLDEINNVYRWMKANDWSAENVGFGMGGALLQKLNRDSLKFAFKASNVIVDGENREIFKQPVGDVTKMSKSGKLKLIETTEHYSGVATRRMNEDGDDLMQTVFRNGELLIDQSFADIRKRAELD